MMAMPVATSPHAHLPARDPHQTDGKDCRRKLQTRGDDKNDNGNQHSPTHKYGLGGRGHSSLEPAKNLFESRIGPGTVQGLLGVLRYVLSEWSLLL